MKKAQSIIWILAFLLVTGCSSTSSEKGTADPDASGTVVIDQTQIMLLVGGSLGNGTLDVKGQKHAFKIGGLKLGGVGVHKLHLTGNVYNLDNVQDFAGTYFSAEAAITLVKGAGGFWMKNSAGVSMHIRASGEGVALGLGLEGVKITLE